VLQCVAGVGSCNKVQAHNESTRRMLLQYAAACCSVLQRAAVCCNGLQCIAVCCSVKSRLKMKIQQFGLMRNRRGKERGGEGIRERGGWGGRGGEGASHRALGTPVSIQKPKFCTFFWHISASE